MAVENGLAVAFLRMDEAVLAGACVAEHPVKRDHRAFDNGAKTGDSAGARVHFHRGEGAVTGAESEHKLVVEYRLRAGARGVFDRLCLGVHHPGQAVDDRLQIALGHIAHC